MTTPSGPEGFGLPDVEKLTRLANQFFHDWPGKDAATVRAASRKICDPTFRWAERSRRRSLCRAKRS